MAPRRLPEWRRNSAQSAGDKVKALMAEISIDALIVTANCRNSWPDTPGMKAIGCRIAETIFIRHQLIGSGVPLRRGDRTYKAPRCDIPLDEWHRRQRYAKSLHGGLELKVDMLKLELTKGLEIRCTRS